MRNNLIRDLDLFRIPEAIFNARAFKFDTNVVVSVTFDIVWKKVNMYVHVIYYFLTLLHGSLFLKKSYIIIIRYDIWLGVWITGKVPCENLC